MGWDGWVDNGFVFILVVDALVRVQIRYDITAQPFNGFAPFRPHSWFAFAL